MGSFGVLALAGTVRLEAGARDTVEGVKLRIVQPSVPQREKWRPEHQERIFLDHLALSKTDAAGQVSSAGITHIIWPEAAIPFLVLDHPGARAAIGEMLPAGVSLLTGALRVEREAGAAGRPLRAFNSILVFGEGGSLTSLYDKVHLVPFGDYFPLTAWLGWFMKLLDIPMSDFSRGTPDQAPLEVAEQKVAANICYEDAFGEEIIRQLPEATLLANFTNDAWWGRSLGSRQHLQIAQMRSLETGRYMLRATNTGMTAIIDPQGRVAKQLPEFEVAVLEGEVIGYRGATPYVRWGNSAVLLICAALLLPLLLRLRPKMKNKRSEQERDTKTRRHEGA